MIRIKKPTILLLCLFLATLIFPTPKANAQKETDLVNKHIISVDEIDNMKIVKYTIDTPGISLYATKNTVYDYFDVYIDNVYSYTLKQTVSYTFAIPSGNGEIAQISSASAKVTKTNSSSAYYPDTSTLTTTITVKSGNPAIAVSTITTRYKSNNKAHGVLNAKTKCYGSGATS